MGFSEGFLFDNYNFENYSLEHFLSVGISVMIGFIILLLVKRLETDRSKRLLGFSLGLFVLAAQIAKSVIRYQQNTFSLGEDLPLHLCNILPFFIPFALYFKNRQLWAVLYYWIMAGTIQSLFTPTLVHSYPNYEWWRYWIVHTGLVMLALYGPFIFGMKARWSDVLKSLFCLMILAFFIFCLNHLLGTNYMYMQGKPPGKTMYDLLGPYPWYILSLHFVALALFSLLTLPFYLKR